MNSGPNLVDFTQLNKWKDSICKTVLRQVSGKGVSLFHRIRAIRIPFNVQISPLTVALKKRML